MPFAEKLKELRKEKSLSQKELADFMGLTRQAIAAYELSKREPSFQLLVRLADYFEVSIDYLLGRTKAKEINAFILGQNIRLVRGQLSHEDFSEKIGKKMGIMIFPEDLIAYEKAERLPNPTVIKVIANFSRVRESFFYKNNTKETLVIENEHFGGQNSPTNLNQVKASSEALSSQMDEEIANWLKDRNNLRYVKLLKKAQEAGVALDSFNLKVD